MTLRGHLLRNCDGAAAAELALILPSIAFILLNVVDLSTYIYAKMQVDLAAHEAVGAARVLCATSAQLPATLNCGTTLPGTMDAAAQSTSLNSGVTLSGTAEGYYCASTSGDLVKVADASATPPVDCSATVAGSTSAPGDYIRTTASYAFSPIFPGASVASYLTSPLVRTSWMRLS